MTAVLCKKTNEIVTELINKMLQNSCKIIFDKK